jgi:hypothetical protein
MKKIAVLFFITACLYAPTTTIYSDWGWGYYFWLFGWVGPSMSEGLTAAGYSSSIEYRGFTQFSMTGWPGPGTTVNSLVLRLRNNTGGSGLLININRVTSETPSGDECGAAPPVYLTSQPVNPGQDEYTYISLPAAAISDFLSAWESGASWFGLGYLGTGQMHFFYAFWADEYYDAALMVDYAIGVEEAGMAEVAGSRLQASPNPFMDKTRIHYALSTKQRAGKNNDVHSAYSIVPGIRIYDAAGKIVKSFLCPMPYALCSRQVTWDGTDATGRRVMPGVYFCELRTGDDRLTEKIIKIR